MNISEIYSAMGLKFKLTYKETPANFQNGNLIQIEPSLVRQDFGREGQYFLISQYGKGVKNNNPVLCKASSEITEYLHDLLAGERDENAYKCMFLIDGVGADYIEVQTYTFRSVTEYKTPIHIIVSDELVENRGLERLQQDYIWTRLGEPALFCLNYKSKKYQRESVRFICGRRCLIAQNTKNGIIAEKEAFLKAQYNAPVDIYVAQEIKFVPMSKSNNVGNEMFEELKKISTSANYFERWEAYDALSKKLLDKESEDFGALEYTALSFKGELSGITYEFTIKEELDNSIIGKEIEVIDEERPIWVGQVTQITGDRIKTYLEDDEPKQLPDKGILKLYTAGDNYIMARRRAARKRMLEYKAPIKSIVALIETGTSGIDFFTSWGTNKAVTERLKRNFKQAANLNAEQLKALDLAINTPNIALIQGPPGTGKTTVIKAITERFREIFESKEEQQQKYDPEYILKSPKILISSFQNEAVDHAISAPLPGDIPAYRKMAKRAKNSSMDQYQKALEKWYSELRKAISEQISDKIAPEYVDTKKRLDDEFLSYKNAEEPIDKAVTLIKRYLSYVDIPYPKDLIDSANAVISAANNTISPNDCENPIIKKIEALRITRESFEDDGIRNASRLAGYIRINDDLDISDEIKEAIESVCSESYTSKEFDSYVKAAKALRGQFCHEKPKVDPTDHETINNCILNLANVFSAHYVDTLSSIESKKSLVLSNFLNRLEQDYETIVKKYSITTAATCQTCLDLHEDPEEMKTYDLVIIDEAARANPLDLFIPMSMGKKIVLVGDHKQLPHMLEPDVIRTLEENSKFKDIPELEKSLFERLFEMFSKGAKPKAVTLTKQFRMHPEICRFVSEAFYDGVLQTAENVTPELRASAPEINDGKPLAFIDISIGNGAEHSGVSKYRPAEIETVTKDVRHILNIDPGASIGVITFYSAQAQRIERKLLEILNDEEQSNIEVGTVDAFQGKEFDYVLLSCVRSNLPKDGKLPSVGFLAKPNRLCVAFSRAMKQLAVYGDAQTLIQIPCFSRLYTTCKEGEGYYRAY